MKWKNSPFFSNLFSHNEYMLEGKIDDSSNFTVIIVE